MCISEMKRLILVAGVWKMERLSLISVLEIESLILISGLRVELLVT